MTKRSLGGLVPVLATVLTGTAWGAWEHNLPEPVSPVTKEIFNLHMLTATIALVIMIIVTAIIVYALWKFRKSKGYEADQNFHKGWFGTWAWVLVPVVVLGIDMSVAGKASKVFDLVEDTSTPDMTLKVIGSQWKWTYEYVDEGFRLVSSLNRDRKPDDPLYLHDVDNPVVLPVNTRIRLLHTSTDVLHAWWVPALAYKKDAIPGYINETWTKIEKEGIYRGQCAEICGGGHAFMPIVIKAVSKPEYVAWVRQKKREAAAAKAAASSNKVWSKDELYARGEAIYKANCAACHQLTGKGVPNVFPALAGSKVTTGDVKVHLDTVIHGRPGTPMAAWGKQMNDLDIASVITYERNAWGNNTGDAVQPADVKAAR
jgi:cytochrome c oxidase subunit 2